MKRSFLAPLCLVTLFTALTPAHSTLLFADSFNDPNGTVLNGKASPVGQGWQVTTGTSLTVQGGAFDTTGGARVIFGDFTANTSPLLTMTFSTLDTTGTFFSGGYAGVSLFEGGTERVFVGDLSGASTSWGVNPVISPGFSLPTLTSEAATLTLTYNRQNGLLRIYNGATAVESALLESRTVGTGWNVNRVRIANNSGGDIKLDSIFISVPEPTGASLAVAGMCALGVARRRR